MGQLVLYNAPNASREGKIVRAGAVPLAIGGTLGLVGLLLISEYPTFCAGVIILIVAAILGIVGAIMMAVVSVAGGVAQAARRPVPPPLQLCPVCGQPLAWIAQYGRWYCSGCAQYR